VPKETVDLSLSYITAHWLNPPYLPSSTILIQESGCMGVWKVKAHYDLVKFFELRAEELKCKGEGFFIMVGGGEVEGGNSGDTPYCNWCEPVGLEHSVFTEALSRAGLSNRNCFVGYYMRTLPEVLSALSYVPSLELLNSSTATFQISTESTIEQADLAWSIHGCSIINSGGLNEDEGERVKEELRNVISEYCSEGGVVPYVCVCVKRKLRN